MIIPCRKCGTRYRFDEALITGEGIWTRCSRCQNVSFHKNPSWRGPAAVENREERTDLPPYQEQGVLSPEDVETLRSKTLAEEEKKSSVKRIVVFAALLILVFAGVFFWHQPETGKRLLETIPGGEFVIEYLGLETPKEVVDRGIDFVDVRETFVKNFLLGDVMVVSGTAVNRSSYPVSNLRIRAKLKDSAGQPVGEAESYCGNVLSDDDLQKLTEKELQEKLSLQPGSGASSVIMDPGAKFPFMIVFVNPPKSAVEFVVETAAVERSTAK